MPTLQRFGAMSVRMYADDHQVLVRISDLRVIEGEARPAQIAEAIAWARAHRESLALKWAELNERN
jgi:Domain of unknown function (DUF4160)